MGKERVKQLYTLSLCTWKTQSWSNGKINTEGRVCLFGRTPQVVSVVATWSAGGKAEQLKAQLPNLWLPHWTTGAHFAPCGQLWLACTLTISNLESALSPLYLRIHTTAPMHSTIKYTRALIHKQTYTQTHSQRELYVSRRALLSPLTV